MTLATRPAENAKNSAFRCRPHAGCVRPDSLATAAAGAALDCGRPGALGVYLCHLIVRQLLAADFSGARGVGFGGAD